MCVRFLTTYWILLFIIKHSPIFDTGLNPKHILSVLIIGIVVVYRFLSMAFVPAVLILWISEILFENHNHSSP